MKTPLCLLPSMGAAVLAHLSKLTQLPDFKARYPDLEEGFIAGQAVASAVSELFFDGLGVVYNDVDAFLLSDKFETTAPQLLRTLEFDSVRLDLDYQRITASITTIYHVTSTRRDGLLNEVLCRPSVRFHEFPETTSKLFLQSFDLNCVQVGVRLSDQALVWTPAFEAFMAQREMLVMNTKTPVHTAIRWFRKKAELEGVFGHDDKAMELLGAMTHRIRNRLAVLDNPHENVTLQRTYRSQTQFGPMYAAKARAVEAKLGKYFELDEVSQGKVTLHTLRPRFDARQELMNDDIPDIVLPTYTRAVQGHWKRHVCERLLTAFTKPRDHLSRVNVMAYGVEAVSTDISPSDMDWMNRQLDEHPGLGRVMVDFAPKMQLAFLQELQKLARVKGLWTYGVFEWLPPEDILDVRKAEVSTLQATLQAVFAKRKADYEAEAAKAKPTRGALKEVLEFDGYRIKELTSFEDICEEGMRMHHCVAGYFTGVTSGTCRIVTLRKHRVQDTLTMELRPQGLGWTNVQLRGLQNRSATDEEHRMAKLFVRALNVRTLTARLFLPLSMGLVVRLCESHPRLAEMLGEKLIGDVKRHYRKPQERLKAKVLKAFCGGQATVYRPKSPTHQWTTYQSPWSAVFATCYGVFAARLALTLGLSKPAPAAANGFDEFDDDIAF